MHTRNTLLPTRLVKEEARITDNQMTHFFQLAERDQNLAAILPGKPETTGKARLFDPLRFALVCLLADLNTAEFKTPLAAKIARRVMDAHLSAPHVEQWAVIYTANDNISTLPYNQSELRTGFISGSRFKFALLVDFKTYADRVERAIADAPRVIGGDDGE